MGISNNDEIKPELMSIGNYLELNPYKNGVFVIPEYQRAYSWEIKNCEQLLNDIYSFLFGDKSQESFFFGTTIIDCSDGVNRQLVDGQQRTTTFFLLLKALHLRIKEILDNSDNNNFNNKDPDNNKIYEILKRKRVDIEKILYKADEDFIVDMSNNWDLVRNREILSNKSINELYSKDFNVIISARDYHEAESKVSRAKYKQKDNKFSNYFKNFKYFYNYFGNENPIKLKDFAKVFLNNCQVIKISCWQLDRAVCMFNSLNSSGMPLNDADIISANLYGIGDTQKIKNLWSSTIAKCETLGSRKITNIDGILRQRMYIDRAQIALVNNKDVDVTTPGLRNYFTSIRKELLTTEPIDFCQSVEKIANIWEKIQSHPSVSLLLKFNDNAKLFLMTYLYRLDDIEENILEQSSELFIRLFATLDILGTTYSSKFFKSFLFRISKQLVNPECGIDELTQIFNDHLDSIYKETIEKYHDSKQFMSLLQESTAKSLVYLNEYLYAKLHGRSIDISSQDIDIEHIMPQSGKNISAIMKDAEIDDVEEFSAISEQIGNKILLEVSINRSIGNEWFKCKKDGSITNKTGYRDSKFPLATALSSYPLDKWTKKDINDATHKASKRILKFVFHVEDDEL